MKNNTKLTLLAIPALVLSGFLFGIGYQLSSVLIGNQPIEVIIDTDRGDPIEVVAAVEITDSVDISRVPTR